MYETQLCDFAEQPLGPAPDTIDMAPWQFVTLTFAAWAMR